MFCVVVCVVVTEQCNVMANCEELTPQNIWRYRGVALTDVVITVFDRVSETKIYKHIVAKFDWEENYLGDPGVEGKIVLKYILRK
jgi:hypothetical protein